MIINISLNNCFPLTMTYLHNKGKKKMKLLNTNVMKVLGPLVTKQYFDRDLDLNEYASSIYEAHSNDYIYGL